MRRLIRKLGAWLREAFEFCSNTLYYFQRGHRAGDACRMAGSTLPKRWGL